MRPYSSLLLLSSVLLLVTLTNTRAQTPPVTIHAARLLDGHGQVMDDLLITVDNGRITRVEHPAAGRRRLPSCSLRISFSVHR